MTDQEKRHQPEESSKRVSASELTPQQIKETRDKVLRALGKARLLPDNWSIQDGRNRDQMISALEQSLAELDALETDISANTHTRSENLQPDHYVAEAGQYITIGNVHIPVCQAPYDNPQWDAVPGTVYVSGGKKFFDVRFVKDVRGLTYTAKPGEPLDFSEKHRGKRLASIDTVLEGRNELKAFNEAMALLGRLTRAYQQLNPDDATYDSSAREIAENVQKLLTPEGFKGLFDLIRLGVEDIDGFAERATDIIRTQQFLRSLDEGLNEFIPPRDTHFKLTPYFEKKFALFATLVNRQLGLGNNAYLKSLVNNEQA